MDILAYPEMAFLGSRLKRLAERFQASAARTIAEEDLPVHPAHLPLLIALDGGGMTLGRLVDVIGTAQPGITRGIGQLASLGLVKAEFGDDRRQRHLTLTPTGRALAGRIRTSLLPRVTKAMAELCAPLSGSLAADLAKLEAGLDAEAFDRRVRRASMPALRIVDYDDERARDFHDINKAWIEAMFELEPLDRDVLEHPFERIIEPGGAILFAENEATGIVGTGALQRHGEHGFELTKMAVRENARGLKAGEFLLRGLLDRAAAMGAEEVFLVSNWKCAAAIHLYEKAGFTHDADIMRDHGARYARCDVAMRYRFVCEERA